MLLDEIIELATSDKQKLSVVLRKCLVLAQKLKNERLKTWANLELDGYKSVATIPEYRIFSAPALGHLSGPFGSGASNLPIPPVLLLEEDRYMATKVYLSQGVGSLQDVVSKGQRTLHFKWSADFVLFYRDRIQTENGMVLVAAEQVLATSAVAGLLDNIRTRALNTALEIQSELGNVEDLQNMTPAAAALVERSITNNIFGGTTIIAGSQTQINVTQNALSVGDWSQLSDVLKKPGCLTMISKHCRRLKNSMVIRRLGPV